MLTAFKYADCILDSTGMLSVVGELLVPLVWTLSPCASKQFIRVPIHEANQVLSQPMSHVLLTYSGDSIAEAATESEIMRYFHNNKKRIISRKPLAGDHFLWSLQV